MITVSSTFTQNTQKSSRRVIGKALIDWNLLGNFVDESSQVLVIEIERKVNLPLGGISVSLADITLTNYNDRYTPIVHQTL